MAAVAGLAVVGTAAVGIGKSIVGVAASFEYEFSRIKANADGTAEEIDKLRDLTLRLGKDTAFSAGETAQAANELVKAGMTIGDVMGALPGMLDLAAAGELNVALAAEITANNLNTFNLKATDATAVADALASAANKSTTDVTDLGLSLSMSAAVAATAGLTIQETSAALALLANNGLKGSDAGTSLKTMFMQLAAPSDKARDIMKNLGIQVYDSSGKMLEFADIIGNVSSAVKPLTQEQRDFALATIFGSDAVRAANIFVKEGEDAYRGMTTALSESGEAQRVATTKMDNLKGAWEEFKGSLETISINLGTKALPEVRNFVEDMTETVNTAIDTGDWSAVGQSVGKLVGDGIEIATPYAVQAAKAMAEGIASASWEMLKDLPDTLFGWGQRIRADKQIGYIEEYARETGETFQKALNDWVNTSGLESWFGQSVVEKAFQPSQNEVYKIKLRRLELGADDVVLSEDEIAHAVANGYPEEKLQAILAESNKRIAEAEKARLIKQIKGDASVVGQAGGKSLGAGVDKGATAYISGNKGKVSSAPLINADGASRGSSLAESVRESAQATFNALKPLSIPAQIIFQGTIGGDLGPGQGPSAGYKAGFGGMTPGTLAGWNRTKGRFPGAQFLGGRSGRSWTSDHPSGRAHDIGGSFALMDAIANWQAANAGSMGIKYIIWNKEIFYPGSGWRPYKPSKALIASGADAWHTGHVHTSYRYAMGGWVGLPPAQRSTGREIPIIAHEGEYVLTQNQAEALFAGAQSYADGGLISATSYTPPLLAEIDKLVAKLQKENSKGDALYDAMLSAFSARSSTASSYVSRESARYQMLEAEAAPLERLEAVLMEQIRFIGNAVDEAEAQLSAAKAQKLPAEKINELAVNLFGLRDQAAEAKKEMAGLAEKTAELARVPLEQAIQGWNAELDISNARITLLTDLHQDISGVLNEQIAIYGRIRDANLQMMNAASDASKRQQYGQAAANAIMDAYQAEKRKLDHILNSTKESVNQARAEWEKGWQVQSEAINRAAATQREALNQQLQDVRDNNREKMDDLRAYYQNRLDAMQEAADAEDRFNARRKLQSELQSIYNQAGKSASDIDRIISLQSQMRDQETGWQRQDDRKALEKERDRALTALKVQQEAEEKRLQSQIEAQEKMYAAIQEGMNAERDRQARYFDEQLKAADDYYQLEYNLLAESAAQQLAVISDAMNKIVSIASDAAGEIAKLAGSASEGPVSAGTSSVSALLPAGTPVKNSSASYDPEFPGRWAPAQQWTPAPRYGESNALYYGIDEDFSNVPGFGASTDVLSNGTGSTSPYWGYYVHPIDTPNGQAVGPFHSVEAAEAAARRFGSGSMFETAPRTGTRIWRGPGGAEWFVGAGPDEGVYFIGDPSWRMDPGLYDDGGWLPPGISTVANFTGKPELVLSPQQLERLGSGRSRDGNLRIDVHIHGDGTSLTGDQMRELKTGLEEGVIRKLGQRNRDARYAFN